MDWIPFFEEKQARYQRSLVMQGNAAYAAGLALLMASDPRSADWLRRAASRWRESFQGADAWGRPIGVLKALLLAGDDVDEPAGWTIELGCATAESPIGRYAASLALLALERREEAIHVTQSLLDRDDFPRDVAAGLAAIAVEDAVAYADAVASVVHSFETRDEYLEDARIADTALVLDLLARRNGIDVPLPASELLPS
ncbi:MAG TPA: hypothetical protein VGL84_01950 [Gaiellaceae bacterium]